MSEPGSAPRLKHRFTFSNLRSSGQPPLSRGMYKLIKSENTAIAAYSSAGDSRIDIAAQLSTWGEGTADPAISSLSDKLGILLTALGQEEKHYAQGLEEYRCVLKQIRNTESGVQPTRERIRKINEEIRRLQYKEPTSGKIVQLEQELVRAEAENLVAEAQLTNVTRAKLKEAYAVQFAAVVERAERQIMLAKYGRMLLGLLDDTPSKSRRARLRMSTDDV